MESVAESRRISLDVLKLVKPVLALIVGTGNVTDHLVRKIAHVIEYGVLGCGLALLMTYRRRIRLQLAVNCMFVSLAVAVIDETIQIYSNRGSQIQDVLLDFAGAAAGTFLVLLIVGLLRKARPKHNG